MKILLTGALGYMGFPLLLKLNVSKHEVVAIDNNARMRWVEKVTGTRVLSETSNVINGDLCDKAFVYEMLALHRPDCILHLASQPSMPYSHINGERALYTQINNVASLLNLIWGSKENGLAPRFVVTTTTGIPGSRYRTIPELPVINSANSFYHVTRGFDSTNMALASRLFNFQMVEFRTSIVYGIRTKELDDAGERTRFDTDKYFGTVVNRFVSQAIKGEKITIYGKGLQSKPFISLQDTVDSLANAVEDKFDKGHTILNQVTNMLSPKDLALLIDKIKPTKIVHIKNPRKENETFQMKFENKGFLRVLRREPEEPEQVIRKMLDYFLPLKWELNNKWNER